jgi:hypothetical protein
MISLPEIERLQEVKEPLDEALKIASPGLWCEFGVATGVTLRRIVAAAKGGRVLGFDSFQGLPEEWRQGYPVGMFATAPPSVPGAELRVGLFKDTLPREDFSTCTLAHIDCDIYSSAKDVLKALEVVPAGCIVVFDELFGYKGFEEHEFKALNEWPRSVKLLYRSDAVCGRVSLIVL